MVVLTNDFRAKSSTGRLGMSGGKTNSGVALKSEGRSIEATDELQRYRAYAREKTKLVQRLRLIYLSSDCNHRKTLSYNSTASPQCIMRDTPLSLSRKWRSATEVSRSGSTITECTDQRLDGSVTSKTAHHQRSQEVNDVER